MILEILQKYEAFETSFNPIGGILKKFVIKNGIEFKNVNTKHCFKLTPKECFKNSSDISLMHNLLYVEGFAIRKSLNYPIHHAWNVDSENRVIDSTWNNSSDCEYYGIIFTKDVLSKQLYKNKVYGLLDIGTLNINLMKKMDKEICQLLSEYGL